jgi:hypothetical protein
MNELIREFAIQSGLPTALDYHQKRYEKFAELIVRECIEQVWYTREDGINGNVSQVIKGRIKQHFGVE